MVSPRHALAGKGPQRRPQQQLDRQLEEVAKAVGGSCCWVQMPLTLALAVRGTPAGQRLGALERGGGATPLPMHPCFAPMPALACFTLNHSQYSEVWRVLTTTDVEDVAQGPSPRVGGGALSKDLIPEKFMCQYISPAAS